MVRLFLMLLGSGAVGIAAWGLVLILDNRGWRWSLLGSALLLLFFPVCITLWSWSAYGFPWEIWQFHWGNEACPRLR